MAISHQILITPAMLCGRTSAGNGVWALVGEANFTVHPLNTGSDIMQHMHVEWSRGCLWDVCCRQGLCSLIENLKSKGNVSVQIIREQDHRVIWGGLLRLWSEGTAWESAFMFSPSCSAV